jgi:hypothetical protein
MLLTWLTRSLTNLANNPYASSSVKEVNPQSSKRRISQQAGTKKIENIPGFADKEEAG